MSIWKSPITLDELNRSRDRTLIRHLDIVFTELGNDFVSASMPVDERTHQPYGLLHGGASVVLAETLGSTGANMCIDRSAYLCVGQEINANHIRSVRSGRVIEIVNEAGALVCISRLTVAVVKAGTLGS
jgi:uncharacterized protein (TIGR00369 family)